MRALILSAYTAVSHRLWCDGVVAAFPEIAWTRLELPPRHFNWRIRANPLLWWSASSDTLTQEFDLVVATSMVDLATLVGLFPALGRARKVVYFHENQFAFPLSEGQALRPEPLMLNLYTAMAADVVVFNSAYNRDSLIHGVAEFLQRMPDRIRLDGWLETLRARASILPVPLPDRPEGPSMERSPEARPVTPRSGRRLVWNHRWEYDKNPETFFAALALLGRRGVDFEVAVMGQQFRSRPPIFDQAQAWLGERVVCWGEQPASVYRRILGEADIVVSTTHHEFQGLAIMEAVDRGCLPLVPDRLCFPEYYAGAYRYDGDARSLADRLEIWLEQPSRRPSLPDSRRWHWCHWREAYARALGLPRR